jgi:hypothetical protein
MAFATEHPYVPEVLTDRDLKYVLSPRYSSILANSLFRLTESPPLHSGSLLDLLSPAAIRHGRKHTSSLPVSDRPLNGFSLFLSVVELRV